MPTGSTGLIGVLVVTLLCICTSVVTGADSARPPWELPYPTRRLAQAGSGNLLPPLDAASAKERWGLRGDASVEVSGVKPYLRLGLSGQRGSLSVPVDVPADRLYEVTFEFKFSPETVLFDSSAPTADERGLSGWISPELADGKSIGPYEVRERHLSPDWQRHHEYVYAITGIARVRIMLGFNASKGSVDLRNISFREATVNASDGLVVIQAPDGTWAEWPHQAEPAPPSELAFYYRRDPDKLFRYSRPAKDETSQPIELHGTPGEVVVAAVGLLSPRNMNGAKLDLAGPTSSDGKRLNAKFECFNILYQPRKTDFYGRHRTFSYVADAFLPRPDGVPLRAGETTGFWLRFTIPADAAAGTYQGTVTLDADGQTRSLPVRLEVLPFTLIDLTDKTWVLYSDSSRWSECTDDQVLRELLDIKSHGYESLILDFEKGDPIWQGDRITGWSIPREGERTMALVQRAGLRGPNLIQWWRDEYQYARKLGIPDGTMKQHADKWPAKLAEVYRQALTAFDAAWKKKGWREWVYVGIDEPGYWKAGSPEFFRFEYDAAAAAGVKSYCTSSDLPSDPIGRPLTYHCVGDSFVDSSEIAKRFLGEGKQYGQQIWFYGSGCYSGQVGSVHNNRYVAGFLFYKSGAAGTASWTFQRPQGDGNAFDDFVREEGQPCITYPDPEHRGENLDTPAWEGLRQGWYDFRYVATLARMIETAKQSGKAGPRVSKIEAEFTSLLEGMPWLSRGFSEQPDTNLTYDHWRYRIAGMILELRQAAL